MFKVTVTEILTGPDVASIERFSQTVDDIDMQAVIQAVNKKPRAPRADKGEKRKKAGE